MKIKFVTGFSCFGGSTIALIEHCRLLELMGHDVELYGECEWHMSHYHKSKRLSEFVACADDFIVFHFMELSERPKCKRCLLYIHEQTLFDMKSRVVSGYDGFVFVSEQQKKYHGVDGVVIPNPMSGLVDKSKSSPPGKNIAGVVGTIQVRKQQKLSIINALEDGMSKVLLFGDKEDTYFKSEIEPLLGEKVEYKGLYDPARRMEMYNEFDVLYNFSSDESASLVLGECLILDKPVVKDENLMPCEILSEEEIYYRWRSVLMSEKIEKMVCVVTYDRKDCIGKWLRAWNNAEKYGAKIAVLHSCDEGVPKHDERENILKYSPDFYVPYVNTDLRDLQALIHVAKEEVGLPDYDYLFWFTDDMLPMRRNFFEPFAKKIAKSDVGLVAQCYEPKSTSAGAHIRTTAYAIKKDAVKKLEFPNQGSRATWPYLFEHGKKGEYDNNLLNQIVKMGYRFELCHSEPESENYQHWTSFLDWMWDCHLLGHWTEYNDIYEDQFNPIQRICGVKTKKETLIAMSQCEELSLAPKKVCAILPTSDAPLEFLVWSLFSLLIRSDSSLDHVIVAINGPDSRTGNTSRQDAKQKFIEELRLLKFGERDMPITLMRTWSRIGHSQTIDQCVPWVHTEFYLVLHDDILILDKNWCLKIKDFEQEDVICATWGNPIIRPLNDDSHGRLELPHFNSIFALCKKSRMKGINAEWSGHYVPMNFYIENFCNYGHFIGWYRKNNLLQEDKIPPRDKEFNALTIDIGGSFIPDLYNNKFRIIQFDDNLLKHFGTMSWCDEERKILVSESSHKEVIQLEKEIKNYDSSWWNLYKKYINPRIERKTF
ncbi:glycosyltransferase family 1 protein [bacterium]|nr:glycosyltransferase family 1 protein [bacterium]